MRFFYFSIHFMFCCLAKQRDRVMDIATAVWENADVFSFHPVIVAVVTIQTEYS